LCFFHPHHSSNCNKNSIQCSKIIFYLHVLQAGVLFQSLFINPQTITNDFFLLQNRYSLVKFLATRSKMRICDHQSTPPHLTFSGFSVVHRFQFRCVCSSILISSIFIRQYFWWIFFYFCIIILYQFLVRLISWSQISIHNQTRCVVSISKIICFKVSPNNTVVILIFVCFSHFCRTI
jgi:hypothetical protein